MVQTVGRSI